MYKISFYRQGRRDGGVRVGIEVDGETILARFEKGGEEEDPILSWFLDVDSEADDVPSDIEGVRDFFLAEAPSIKAGLENLAREIEVGLDVDSWPVRVAFEGNSPARNFRATCFSNRRAEARRMPEVVRDTATRWEPLVRGLVPEVSPIL